MRYLSAITIFFLYFSASEAQNVGDDWPLFRGKADLSGKYESELPSSPGLYGVYLQVQEQSLHQ